MLSPDVVMAELQCLPKGKLKHLLGARSEGGDVTGRGGLLALANDLLHLFANAIERNAQGLERLAATPSPSWIRPKRMCSVPM